MKTWLSLGDSPEISTDKLWTMRHFKQVGLHFLMIIKTPNPANQPIQPLCSPLLNNLNLNAVALYIQAYIQALHVQMEHAQGINMLGP